MGSDLSEKAPRPGIASALPPAAAFDLGRWIRPGDTLMWGQSSAEPGHPIGATGVRIMCALLHELRRRDGRYGLETMCIGGGLGFAAVFERV